MKLTATVLACDFCGKTRAEVTKLISGPAPKMPCICEACIQLCTDIIATKNAEESANG